TRTTDRSSMRSGRSTATPCGASDASRPWSSGTRTSRPWTTCSPRPSARAPSRPTSWRMLALPELQRAFWRAITAGKSAPELLGAVASTVPLGAQARLDVYATMYAARIVEVLQEDFPKLAALAGDEGFAALVRDYVGRHPSTEPSIGWIGASLPAFL